MRREASPCQKCRISWLSIWVRTLSAFVPFVSVTLSLSPSLCLCWCLPLSLSLSLSVSVSVGRFIFDWTTEQSKKLGDRVTFPETLDVAPYLDEAPARRDDGAAAAAGGGGGGDADRSNFGKDGSSILMRGRSAVGLEAPHALNYDLYVLHATLLLAVVSVCIEILHWFGC